MTLADRLAALLDDPDAGDDAGAMTLACPGERTRIIAVRGFDVAAPGLGPERLLQLTRCVNLDRVGPLHPGCCVIALGRWTPDGGAVLRVECREVSWNRGLTVAVERRTLPGPGTPEAEWAEIRDALDGRPYPGVAFSEVELDGVAGPGSWRDRPPLL
jgi:hypothetical protein